MDTRAKRYRLVRSLGRGGMAEVFEAVAEGELGFARRVAIKRMLPELCGEPDAERAFLDEARIASRLYHAGIVSVLDLGTAEGRPFQVLELVDGPNLEQLARHAERNAAPLSAALACHVVAEVARALYHAHTAADSAGAPACIVHRDVTPTNILVAKDGTVKLTDFGIATARDRLHRTVGVVVKGTVHYMAPEQARGVAVDARADLFALGCVLHRLLVGKSPLDGVSLAARILGEAAITIAPDIPPQLRALLESMLSEVPDARPVSGAAVAAELDGLIATLPRCDARAELRARVADLPAKRSVRGALDELLDVALVFSDTAPTDTARTFTVQAVPRAEPAPATPEEPGRALPAARRRLAGPLVGAAATLVLFVGAALWSRQAPPPPSRLALPNSDTWEERVPASLPGIATAPDQSVEVPQSQAASPPTARSARAASRVEDTSASAPPGASHSALDPGAGAQRAEIIVDGASRGYAPKRIELPAGPHTLVVQGSGGRPLASERIELSAAHTASHPLVVRLP